MKRTMLGLSLIGVFVLTGCGNTDQSTADLNAHNTFTLSVEESNLSPEGESFPLHLKLEDSTFANDLDASMITLGGFLSGMSISDLTHDSTSLSFTATGTPTPSGGTTCFSDGEVSFDKSAILGSVVPATVSVGVEADQNTIDDTSFALKDGYLNFKVVLSDDTFTSSVSGGDFWLGITPADAASRLDSSTALLSFKSDKTKVSEAVASYFSSGEKLAILPEAIEHGHLSQLAYAYVPLDINALLISEETKNNALYFNVATSVLGGHYSSDVSAICFVLDPTLTTLKVDSFTLSSSNNCSGTLVLRSDDLSYDPATLNLEDILVVDSGALLYPWGEDAYGDIHSSIPSSLYPNLSGERSVRKAASSSASSATTSGEPIDYDPRLYYDTSKMFGDFSGAADFSSAEAICTTMGSIFDTFGSVVFEVGKADKKLAAAGEGMLALGKLFEAGALVCKLLGISKTTSVDEAQRDGFRAILAGISCLSSQIADVNNAISDRDNKSIVHDFSTKMSNLEDVETKKINVDLMDAYAAINNHLPTEADDITECLPALIYFSEQHRSEADDYIIQVNQFMTAIVKEMEDPYSEYNPFHALDNCFAHDTYFYAEHGGKIAQYRYSVMLQLIKSFNLAAAIQRGIVYSDIRNRSTLSGTELDNLCLAAYARALSSGLGQNYNDASDTLKPYLDNFNNGIRLELRNDGYYTSNLKAAVYSCFCYPLHKQVAFEVLTAYTLGNTGMVIPTNASDHGMTPLGLRDRFFRSQFTDGSITNGRAADALKVLNLYYGSDYYAPYRKLAAPAMSLNGQVGADASRTPDRFRFALRGYANNKSAGNERWGTYDIYGAEGRGLIEDNNYHLTYPEAVTNKDLGIYRWTPYYLPDSPRMATIVLTHRSSSK